VNIHDKQNATDRTLVVNADPADAVVMACSSENGFSDLAGAALLVCAPGGSFAAALGNDARTYPAQLESGTYRGKVIGETAGHVVQRVSSRSAVAHPKDALDRQPMVGENVFINYSTGKAVVGDVQQRTRDREFVR
jgi:hypothetical protein